MHRLSFTHDLPLTQAALEFAEAHHAHQQRMADGAPFVMHPIEVASLLARDGCPDYVVAAAVLHDVLEDTDVQRTELDGRFGVAVGELVASVSDDPSIPDEDARKDELRERVRRAGGYALAVHASDKVSRVRELRYLVTQGLTREEADRKLQRHRKSLLMLEQELPGSRLVELLRFELESFEAFPPGRTKSRRAPGSVDGEGT
jgi:(p)ppGpp synthase/HD superfamily hydrolase